jgi:hypothetical protein
MAYATLHLPEHSTLYLSAHEGGFVPGDKFSSVEIVMATDLELQNLPPLVKQHQPDGDNWIDDLKSDLAKLTSNPTQLEQLQILEEVRRELVKDISTKKEINQSNKTQHRDRGR